MIHRYSLKGKNFLLDVNSGSVHVLDEISYAVSGLIEKNMHEDCPMHIIKALPQFSEKEIKDAYSELHQLEKDGYIFSDDSYIDATKYIPVNAPVKALCLHVSHDCNLRCKYCFASTGDFGTGRKIMDFEVAQKAIDFVVKKSGARRNIEIDFFGGEPLMAFETVKKTVEYAKSIEEAKGKKFRFTITTNGMLLNDDIIDYINNNMDNVVLSLDGRKEVHDNMRKMINGKGSYDYILPKFQKLVSNRDKSKDYYLRGTFTKNNLDFASDVLHIAEQGFDQLSVEPVTSEEGMPYALTEEDLPTILSEYEKLCDIMLEKEKKGEGFNFFHFMIDLDQGPCIIKRIRGCGAGCEYVAVTPEGDIYPCHQFVGNEEYRQGSVFDGSFDEGIANKFAAQNVYTRNKCSDCWAKFYCSGGCSAANKTINNDLNEPYELGCEMERKRIECAIYVKACKAENQI